MKKQDVFREIEHIESFSVLGDTIDETESFYRLQNENNSTVVTMKFEQNILTNLDFIVSKGYNLRLNEVIELIGQPTYTLGWFTGHGLASRKVFLCYSEKGIQVDLVGETHHEPPNHPYKVSEDSKVWTINVFRPDIPNNLNSNYYACLEAESHYYVQKEWHGYGVYITCDPETMDWCGE
ncbi:MAG TPA: hypothetical protein GXX60_03380 [Anaerolineaceae bacterium]|nr:hypothetical protein [Anaerolineaceae bacterium]